MQVITISEIESRKQFYARQLKKSIFIYPTDTIYGVGCNALDGRLIDWVRDMKRQPEQPFAVLAPSKEWIRKHCVVDEQGEEWLEKLPGPYTLIFRIKEVEEFPRSLTLGSDLLGVRIPDHWISCLVKELGVPIVTTGANRRGDNILEDITDLPSDWREDIEFAIDEGRITGNPSTLVHLHDEVVVEER